MLEAHYNLGIALRDLGRRDEALARFREVLRLRPEYPEARWSLALARIPQVYGAGEDPANRAVLFEDRAPIRALEEFLADV